MFAKPWLRFALAAGVALGALGAAQTIGAADTAPVKMEGLRGGTPLNQDNVPASFKQDTPVTKIDNDWYAGLYIQDDFRIHPRLTLNLGLRYELPTSLPASAVDEQRWPEYATTSLRACGQSA